MSLRSMTGFGRYEMADSERKIVVEIKAVNHRYCDVSVRMPKKISFFEAGVRNVLKRYISRGKVDVFISYEDYGGIREYVRYNTEIAREYWEKLQKIGRDFEIENDVSVSVLSGFPEVLTIEEQAVDEGEIWSVVENAVQKAAERFVEAREAEGENLKQDLLSKLDGMRVMVDFIEERAPQVIAEYRKKLKDKISELLGDVKLEENILAAEVTVFADRICVDEETVRLKSHINSMKAALCEGANIGRKLDFIAQEMNREANTILSKSSDLAVTNRAIDLKTEIEKVREQIQNIE